MTENSIFPDFQLVTEDNQPISREDLRNQTTILFFYPKDMTPGCTTEACALRDDYSFFQEKGIQIYGVSPDDAESHQKFIAKHNLPFSLIVDTDHKLAESLGIWVEKSMYGKKFWGIERSTFVVGPDLQILAAFRKVNPAEHSAQLQEFLSNR